ncbi:hypothetical protein EVAR_53099_1 [Eumeta japonica]|uniref:Uncharacterized protein n=1 Tax=Eumeta variegata TaxID=151549 RepID=A0A4C1ZJ14_EUMVA|nr:hypothetical protein EVAR_53099_1 [Eumeta japonica]
MAGLPKLCVATPWGVACRCDRVEIIQKVAPRSGPVKAAIIILDSSVNVEEDQTFIDENVTAAVITIGKCRINVVLVYLEGDRPIDPYLKSALSSGLTKSF